MRPVSSRPNLSKPVHMTASQIALAGPIANLADVSAKLERHADIDDARRLAYQGAIRTLCKVLARPAAAIPSDLRRIDGLIDEIPAIVRGVSRKTLANVRSRLKSALNVCHKARQLPPKGTPLAPAWASLQEQIVDLRIRTGLSRLIRIASYHGVAPEKVDDEFVRQLVDDVSSVNWGRDTLPTWRRTVALWNEAVTRVPGWPQVHLTPPPASQRLRHLPLNAFPKSFQDDLEKYLRKVSGGNLFDKDTHRKPLKPATLRLRSEQLRIAASILSRAQGDVASITSLATLVKPDNAKTILTSCLDAHPKHEPTAFIRNLALTLVTVARDWLQLPDDDELEQLLEFKRRLGNGPVGLTEKNRRVVAQCTDPAVLQQLLKLPDVLRKQVRERRLSPARRLQKMQTALAIELLLVAPMRLQNLASLRLGTSLQRPTHAGGTAFVSLRADETKNDQPLEYPVEGQAREVLDEYVDRYRAYAAVKDSDWLFVHLDGTPFPAAALRDGITKATRRELGVAITPHQFRHLAAAIALDHRPGALGLVRDLLGHQNIKTTLNFYAGMRTRQAGREWSQIMTRVRDNGSSVK